jgi:hypothetical protein
MKRLIEFVLEKYDAGYTVSEIARDSLGVLTEDQVGQIILEYTESADYDDSMDGDFDSAMTSAGFGTDEDYGYYGDGE